MKYKISDLSKLLHIPVPTLRFLEKKGIVAPERDTNNAYRVFDTVDFLRLIEYKMYQSMGMSLKQVTEITTANDLQGNIQAFRDNLNQLKHSIEYQQLLYACLAEFQQKMENCTLNLNRCWVKTQKPKYALEFMMFGDDWRGDIEEYSGTLFRWIDAFPFVSYYAETSIASVFAGVPIHNMTFMVDQTVANSLTLPIENARLLPEQKQISMMVCFEREGAPTKAMLKKILDFAQENDLKVEKTLIWQRIIPGAADASDYSYERYYELLLPLAD